MPMFEYKCRDCGTVSEFLVGVTSSDPEIACESCGGAGLNKVISPISISVKHGSDRFPIAGQCGCADSGRAGCGDGCCCAG